MVSYICIYDIINRKTYLKTLYLIPNTFKEWAENFKSLPQYCPVMQRWIFCRQSSFRWSNWLSPLLTLGFSRDGDFRDLLFHKVDLQSFSGPFDNGLASSQQKHGCPHCPGLQCHTGGRRLAKCLKSHWGQRKIQLWREASPLAALSWWGFPNRLLSSLLGGQAGL